MKLINLIPLKEIDFRNQDAFDAYTKQHDLRPSTKVKIAGKMTTAGQASQKSSPVKGTSVFGNNKGGEVFGKKPDTTDIKSKAKELLSKSDYDEKHTWKLSDTADDIYSGLGTDTDSKELALKLKKNTKGVYVQTDELGGHILFSDGAHYEINSDEGGDITASKVGADGKKKSGKDYIVKGDNQVIVRVDDTIETTESALDQIITDPKKNTRALAKYAMDSIGDMKKIVKQLKGNHDDKSGKDYIAKGDNQVIVRVDDSIQTAEDALNQIITDPKKNTRALAKYAMDTMQDVKQIVKQLKSKK